MKEQLEAKDYVYKEVVGDGLEKATVAGWEFVGSETASSASSQHPGWMPFPYMPSKGFYLVRRPRELSNEQIATDKLAVALAENAKLMKDYDLLKGDVDSAKRFLDSVPRATCFDTYNKKTIPELKKALEEVCISHNTFRHAINQASMALTRR